ncbi:MAG: hypothetical protein Q8M94_17090 [Ignavibacteria bacterium]|nr:hypothetical protein [Ignavibacteria bacterium]
MKPIFTIHAGEYLVASHLEEKKEFKDLQIWLPSSDTGIDLLITNPKLSSQNSVRAVSLQVKFSKDFLGNKGDGKNSSPSINSKIKAGGWWTFKYDKIEKSQADLWVLVLYRFSDKKRDFIIIEPSKLLERYRKLERTSGTIQSYVWVTENGQCWETRGLGKAKQEEIATDVFKDSVRDLSQFLNNWQPLKKRVGL